MTGNPESADRANPWAAVEASGAFLPPEAWSVRIVCTGRGKHKSLTLARYHHDAADAPRPINETHLQGGQHMTARLFPKGRWQDGDPRRMRERLPHWEPLTPGDPSIPPGPWGDEPQWGWGQFGRTWHAYIFLCSRCPTADGEPRTGRAREVRVDSYRFVDVYVREAVNAGRTYLDVSDCSEW